jgi:hypothetical protein
VVTSVRSGAKSSALRKYVNAQTNSAATRLAAAAPTDLANGDGEAFFPMFIGGPERCSPIAGSELASENHSLSCRCPDQK